MGPPLLVLRDVAAKKPVIINKGGLSEAGGRAVASHTASMGGSHKIWQQAVLNQSGAIQVGDLVGDGGSCLAFSLVSRAGLSEYHRCRRRRCPGRAAPATPPSATGLVSPCWTPR